MTWTRAHTVPFSAGPHHPSRWDLLRGTWETIIGNMPLFSFQAYQREEKRCIIDAGEDLSAARSQAPVRLVGYWNEAQGQARGTILLIHGWEGNSHGTDTLCIGSHLNRLGFHTMRLNFRDHGNSHIYNEGIFNGSLIAEISQAASRVAGFHPQLPFSVVGSSLGGNFALRLGYRDNATSIPNLQSIIAVCPALDPHAASVAIDRHPVFRAYFCRAWKASLAYKSRIFARSLCLRSIDPLFSVVSITKALAPHHFGFDDPRDYYETYTVTPAKLRSPRCPIHIITSRNDPIITVDQFEPFHKLSGVSLQIEEHGGHVGFMNLHPFQRQLPMLIEASLTSPNVIAP